MTPAGCAAWIPAGFRHSVAPAPAARVRTLYIWRATARLPRRACAVWRASPFLAALIDHLCKIETLTNDTIAARRLASVLLDHLGDQHELPLFVPTLRSPLAQRVAAALAADLAGTPRIRDLAGDLGASSRTLERAFAADAGMAIGEWRQRARVSHAIALLAGGGEVRDVALEVGYETASAFIAAFKKVTGITPGAISRS